MARQIVTSLDVGTHTIRIVVALRSKKDSHPEILALVEKESRGMRQGYITQFDDAVESIRGALDEASKKAGVRIRRVLLGMGGVTLGSSISEGSTAIARADQDVTQLDVKRAIEASEASMRDSMNKQVLHQFPISYKLDGKRVLGRPIGLKGNQLEVRTLFITALAQHVSDLERAVEEAGVAVEDIVATPVAASFVALSKVQKMAGCILAHIGAETVSTIVFEEGIPVSLAVFPLGSNDITNDIALGLRIPIEEAEEVKLGLREALVTRKKLDEIMAARLEDIFELIEAHLKKIGRSALLPAGIIFTGPTAALPLLEAVARDVLSLPARRIPEIAALFAGSKEDDSARKQLIPSAWSPAYGLVVLGGDFEAEESLGVKLVKDTKNNFLYWLKQLMP